MYNKYKIFDDYAEVYTVVKKTKQCLTIIVDIETLERMLETDITWHGMYHQIKKDYYISGTIYLGVRNGKPRYKSILLHRWVIDAPDDKVVDHINNNQLDNRKSNLRLVTQLENSKNRKGVNCNNKSGYRNVCWIESEQKWVVQLQVDGKNTRLGKFDDVHEAGKFAEEKRKEIYGEYAGRS